MHTHGEGRGFDLEMRFSLFQSPTHETACVHSAGCVGFILEGAVTSEQSGGCSAV